MNFNPLIDHDVIEGIRDFTVNASKRNIQVDVADIPDLKVENRYQSITAGVRN